FLPDRGRWTLADARTGPADARRHRPDRAGPARVGLTRAGIAADHVGFSGDFGGSYFLSKLVGTGKARELYYTAEPLDAAQALALGIVNRVVPDPELVEATMPLARMLARGPRIALARMKQNFNAAESGTLGELLDLEAQRQIETGRTQDHKEAARAFVEK